MASYLGEGVVEVRHVVLALDILQGARTLESVGRPLSPLVRRPPGGPSVEPNLRELIQRWWTELGSDPQAELGATGIATFLAALAAMESPR